MNQSTANNKTQADTLVLGAGIVGLCAALALHQRGRRVVLVDRDPPGQAASFGNSGVVGPEFIEPLADPDLLRNVWSYLSGRSTKLRVAPASLLRLLPWFLANIAAGKTGAAKTTAGLHALVHTGPAEHLALARDAGCLDLYCRNGWIQLYRTKDLREKHAYQHALWRDHAIEFDELDAGQLSELEPNLKQDFYAGVWLKSGITTLDPGGVCVALAKRFTSLGGTILRGDARSVRAAGPGFEIDAEGCTYFAADLVVALGAWSLEVTRKFGYRPPLTAQRGYHRHFTPPKGAALNHTLVDVDAGYVMAPMKAGIRVTSSIEFAPINAPKTPVQLNAVVALARGVFPLGAPVEDQPWMGARPALPDSLPVIGRLPGVSNIWVAFGHGYVGFTAGPLTGALIGQAMSGEAPSIDLAPFAPDRF
ncbi:MAG: NAD(P)/FAD-dependent oxidoreductase [Alphaproteobacteria bacterium]